MPFLDQVMVGSGLPEALQSRRISSSPAEVLIVCGFTMNLGLSAVYKNQFKKHNEHTYRRFKV